MTNHAWALKAAAGSDAHPRGTHFMAKATPIITPELNTEGHRKRTVIWGEPYKLLEVAPSFIQSISAKPPLCAWYSTWLSE